MFLIFIKIISLAFKPLGIMLLLLTYSVFHKNSVKSKRITSVVLIFFFFFSLPVVNNLLLGYWEPSPKQISSLSNYDLGIILTGGIINENASKGENIFMGDSGDRAFQALRLYRAKKIKKVLISGGELFNPNSKLKTFEHNKIKEYLIINGVDTKDIIQENRSRNTFENAKFSSPYIKKYKSAVIITSAFHIRRAIACFKKQGHSLDFFPTSYLKTDEITNVIDFFPTTSAFKRNDILWNEMLGFIGYKLTGKI